MTPAITFHWAGVKILSMDELEGVVVEVALARTGARGGFLEAERSPGYPTRS